MALPYAFSGDKKEAKDSFYTTRLFELKHKNESDARVLAFQIKSFLSEYFTFHKDFDGVPEKKKFYFTFKSINFKLKINKHRQGVLFYNTFNSAYECENENIFDPVSWVKVPDEVANEIVNWFLTTIESYNRKKQEERKEQIYNELYSYVNRVG